MFKVFIEAVFIALLTKLFSNNNWRRLSKKTIKVFKEE